MLASLSFEVRESMRLEVEAVKAKSRAERKEMRFQNRQNMKLARRSKFLEQQEVANREKLLLEEKAEDFLLMMQHNVRSFRVKEASNHEVVYDLNNDKLSLLFKHAKAVGLDMFGLQEVRRDGMGKEVYRDGDGTSLYTFLWCGNQFGEHTIDRGVAFAYATDIGKDVEMKGVSDRLMLVTGVFKGVHMAIFVIHFPTNNADVELKSLVLEQISMLRNGLDAKFKEQTVFFIDSNAQIGRYEDLWSEVRGSWGVMPSEVRNSNGTLLLQLCDEENLCLANSFFENKSKEYATWFHPDPKLQYPHVLDYLAVSRSLFSSVAFCGIEKLLECDDYESDHRPVFLKLSVGKKVESTEVKSSARAYRKSKSMSIDVSVLKGFDYQKRLSNEFERQLGMNLIKTAAELTSLVNAAATKILPPKRKRKKNACWFSENDKYVAELLETRRFAKWQWLSGDRSDASMKAVYVEAKKKCRQELRRVKRKYFDEKSQAAQEADSRHDSKTFCSIIDNFVPNKEVKIPEKVLLKDGKTLSTSVEERSNRFTEFFCDLFNPKSSSPSSSSVINVDYIPRQELILWFLQDPFSLAECQAAVLGMKDEKSLGIDRMAIEFLKYLLFSVVFITFLNLANFCLQSGQVFSEWKDVIISPIFKKGDDADLNNYRGISLISHFGKLLEKIITIRLTAVAELYGWLPESQNGFRVGRSTSHSIFVSRLVSSLCVEKGLTCCKAFIDFVKAYDKVNQELLWLILERRGVPPKMVALIRAIHENSMARVKLDGELSDPFQLSCGLKQGSMLSPLLFNIFSGAMIEAINDRVKGLGMKFLFRRGGEVFDITNIKSGEVFHIWNILFADDAELLADSPENLQRLVDIFVEVSTAYGQEVSLKKSEVLLVNQAAVVAKSSVEGAPQELSSVDITVYGSKLQSKDSFSYLGAPEDVQATMDVVLEKRMKSGNKAFNMRNAALFNNRELSYTTKLRYYVVYVISVLTYACETWTTTAAQLRNLEGVQRQMLRRIFRFWNFDDKISYLDVLLLARRYGVDVMPLEILISTRRLLFLGSCEKMAVDRVCHKLLHSDLEGGSRSKGSWITFRSSIKCDLKKFGLIDTWKNRAVLSEKDWRAAVKKGSMVAFRRWLIEKHHWRVYKVGEITAKGRAVKEMSAEMLSSMRVYPTGETNRATRSGRAFADEVSCTWNELELLREEWDFATVELS